MQPKPLYRTEAGRTFVGDSIDLLASLADDSVDLVMTPPPSLCNEKRRTETLKRRNTSNGSSHLLGKFFVFSGSLAVLC